MNLAFDSCFRTIINANFVLMSWFKMQYKKLSGIIKKEMIKVKKSRVKQINKIDKSRKSIYIFSLQEPLTLINRI